MAQGKRRSPNEFAQIVQNNFGDRITLLGPYVQARTPILVRCNRCGSEFSGLPFHLAKGHACRKCGWDKSKLTQMDSHEEACAKLRDIHSDRIMALETYPGVNHKWRMMCDQGHEFSAKAKHLFSGMGCAVCAKRAAAEKITGSLNVNWRGGLQRKDLAGRVDWLNVRKRVLVRDICCRLCDSSHRLEVHHIEPYSKNPTRWLDIDNLILLCKNCHSRMWGKEERWADQLRASVCPRLSP